jgi:hypothetical protein
MPSPRSPKVDSSQAASGSKSPSGRIVAAEGISADGAKGFWCEMQIQGTKDDPEIGDFGMPQVFARLGDKEKVLKGLDRSFDARTSLCTFVNVDPAFVSLHSDPRFESQVRRMGLRQDSKLP